jgi:hypothetical protein
MRRTPNPRSVVFQPLLLGAALLLLAGCPGQTPGQDQTCSTSTDCPEDRPFCTNGLCVAGSTGTGCETDADCSEGVCNLLTGQCQEAQLTTCEDDEECESGEECIGGVCRIPGSGGCGDANDCEPNQICQQGSCVDFDDSVACNTDADCPRDHECNFGVCEGCFNDAYCIGSPNGPKCSVEGMTDAPVPPGYCFKECGADVGRDCPPDHFCDAERGGICAPACESNIDCEGGRVCVAGLCESCTSDTQCDGARVCSPQGSCIEPPECTQQLCNDNLGAAYYCDSGTGRCLLGCTDHAPGACGALDQPSECNPCSVGEICNTNTGACSADGTGPGCDCTALNCSAQGLICDTVTCACVSSDGGGGNNGGSGGTVGEGGTCLHDSDCQDGMTCFGSFGGFWPGECLYTCKLETLCACPAGRTCYDDFGNVLACGFFDLGICQ